MRLCWHGQSDQSNFRAAARRDDIRGSVARRLGGSLGFSVRISGFDSAGARRSRPGAWNDLKRVKRNCTDVP
jgi:hypothetical protein